MPTNFLLPIQHMTIVLKQISNYAMHSLGITPLVLPLFTIFKASNPIDQLAHLDNRFKFLCIHHHICIKKI